MTSLAPGAVEILLGSAEILSEGAIRETEGSPTYFGMTMITVDLERAATRLRLDPLEDGPALARRVARSAELRLRALRIARLEAERRAGGRLPGVMRAELAARSQGTEVLVDVEVELPVDVGRRRSATRS